MLKRVLEWVSTKPRTARVEDPEAKIIFVLGTGRSGTHFLTHCMIGNAAVTDHIGGREDPRTFPFVSISAVDLTTAPRNIEIVRKRYVRLARQGHPKWYIDQAHPNIWFAEYWSAVFPSAFFVGIVRDPRAVVASMMEHPGVRGWVERWDQYPVPNRFLGITAKNRQAYAEMSLVERCAMRWAAHYRRMQDLRDVLGERLRVIRYEDLAQAPEATLAPLAQRLQIPAEFRLPTIRTASLTKYEKLSAEELASIERIVEDAGLRYPPEEA